MGEGPFVSQQEHEFIHKSILEQIARMERGMNGWGERVTRLEQDFARMQERDESQWKMIGKLEAKIDVVLSKIDEISRRSVRVWEAVVIGILGAALGSLISITLRIWTKGG